MASSERYFLPEFSISSKLISYMTQPSADIDIGIWISIYFLYRRRRNNSLTFFYSFCIVSKIHLNIQEESLPFHRLQLSPTNNDNIEAAPKNSSNYFFPDFLHWLVFSIVFFYTIHTLLLNGGQLAI